MALDPSSSFDAIPFAAGIVLGRAPARVGEDGRWT